MRKDDLFIFTNLNGMRSVIQVLGEHANALSPPHHLNFLNPKSVSLLLEKDGFKVLEAITPGNLNAVILKNNRHLIKDAFWKNILEYFSELELSDLQNYIATSGLSSYMMITCRKS